MRNIPYTPPYDRPANGFSPAPETGVACSICGRDIVWWSEAWVMDKRGICHAECVEKEKENGSEETC